MKTLSTIFLFALISIFSSAQTSTFFDTLQTVFTAPIEVYDEVQELPEFVPRLDNREGVNITNPVINGARIYLQQEGNGIPMLLIHGGPGGTSHVFHPFFANAKKYCRVIYFDQRGCGLSEFTGDSTYSLSQLVSDIEALRLQLGIDKWYVLGYSFGGFLAQRYTQLYPEHIFGTILVNSEIAFHQHYMWYYGGEHLFLSKKEWETIIMMWDMSENGVISEATGLYNAELNGSWKRQSYYKPKKSYAAQTAMYEWHHDTNFNSILSNATWDIDFTGCFKNCPIPFYIIEGKWDGTWPKSKLAILKDEFPNASFHIIDHSAHSPFQDNPDAFFSTIESIVKNQKNIQSEQIAGWKILSQTAIESNASIMRINDRFIELIENEEYSEAYSYYRKEKQIHPQNRLLISAHLINTARWLGRTTNGKNKPSEAIDLLLLCLEEYPEADICYYYIAKSYQALGNSVNAEKYMKKYIALTTNTVDAQNNLNQRYSTLMEKAFR